MKVLVIGSNGYVGTLLVNYLLADGHEVVGFDPCWFGNGYWSRSHNNDNNKLIVGDMRQPWAVYEAAKDCDAALILGCISNDTSYQLDEKFAASVNIDAFPGVMWALKKAGVKRVVYCSSSSVYGVSHLPEVTEMAELVPMTLYNTSKAMCERVVWDFHEPGFDCTVIRPATVCGYSPRQRFDLTVNIMTRDAVCKGKINVHGGEQKRPNLHIKDMCDVYLTLLNSPLDLVSGQTFNVGQQNLKVLEIAQTIKTVVDEEFSKNVEIEVQDVHDARSYHISSKKIYNALGWHPKFTVEDAIRDLCDMFHANRWKEPYSSEYTNIIQYLEKKVA